MEEVTTPETLPDGGELASADGGGADQTGNITLDTLKETLGKEFKDPETALKSIKDTYAFVGDVGKVKQTITRAKEVLGVSDDNAVLEALNKLMEETKQDAPTEQKVDATQQPKESENFITREQYQEDIFFSKHGDLEEVRDILTPLKNATVETKSMSWNDFIGSDSAKRVISSFSTAKEAEATKSVLESNPRLGSATDKMSQAKELIKTANDAIRTGDIVTSNQAQNQARENAVASVIEAFELK